MRFEIGGGGIAAIAVGLALLSGAVFFLGMFAGYDVGRESQVTTRAGRNGVSGAIATRGGAKQCRRVGGDASPGRKCRQRDLPIRSGKPCRGTRRFEQRDRGKEYRQRRLEQIRCDGSGRVTAQPRRRPPAHASDTASSNPAEENSASAAPILASNTAQALQYPDSCRDGFERRQRDDETARRVGLSVASDSHPDCRTNLVQGRNWAIREPGGSGRSRGGVAAEVQQRIWRSSSGASRAASKLGTIDCAKGELRSIAVMGTKHH